MTPDMEKIVDAVSHLPNASREKVEEAVLLYENGGRLLGEVFVRQGIITEDDYLMLLVREFHIPWVDLKRFHPDDRVREMLPEASARELKVLPVASIGDNITVAVSEPLAPSVEARVKEITSRNVDMVLCTSSQIREMTGVFYGSAEQGSVSDISKTIDVGDFEIVSDVKDEDVVDVDKSEHAPVIRMVNLVIKEAFRQRASDIHMEPSEGNMRVRYRVDGVLHNILEIPRANQGAVIVRIKIMSRIDITTSQIPQDGRFAMRLSGKEIDFRVSILPTTFGPKVVLRVLDKAGLAVGVEQLGFSPTAIRQLQEGIARPFGMLLVTGPTGSGKSTTLYSIVNKLNSVDRNIITVEDPVEYLVDGLTQIEARADVGLTFAAALRSILRQSPDVVMVGEIRDNETADIAIKASLTGQLVLSTLHTNDAAGALTRLVDMKVEPFLVASSLVLVTAQRLCRRICPHCRTEDEVAPEVLRKIPGLDPATKFYRGRGCARCRQIGYLGRFGVTEVLMVDDTVREMLLQGKSSDDIKEYACKIQGMKTLWDDAVSRVVQGQTTVEELFRIASNE